MPVFDRFVPTLTVPRPIMYLVNPADTAIVVRLRQHGVQMKPLRLLARGLDEFIVDSIVRAPRPFQGHNEVRVVGRWRPAVGVLPPEMLAVPVLDPFAPLVMYLLDPESDDSFATWNLLDDRLRVGEPYPVLRMTLASGQR